MLQTEFTQYNCFCCKVVQNVFTCVQVCESACLLSSLSVLYKFKYLLVFIYKMYVQV